MSSVTVLTPDEPLGPLAAPAAHALERTGALVRGPSGLAFAGPGFAGFGPRLWVVLPRPYRGLRDRRRQRKAALLLMGVLRRYERRKQRAVSRHRDALVVSRGVRETQVLTRLHAALRLTVEFAERGTFVLSTARWTNSHGRIHWPRTLTRHPPVGQLFGEAMTGWARRRVRPDPEHALCVAHRHSLEIAARYLQGRQVLEAEHSALANLVQAHAHEAFSDRAKLLVDLMLQLHQQREAAGEGRAQPTCLLIAQSFHVVWEHMLRQVLGPTLTSTLPRGRYCRTPGEEHVGARWNTDLIVESDDFLYILDAKDYAPGSYPPTADLSKQILYRLFHTTQFDASGTRSLNRSCSAFLFPGATSDAEGVTLRGIHQLDRDPQGWGDVACIDVDFARVANAYVRGRADPTLRAATLKLARASTRQDPR